MRVETEALRVYERRIYSFYVCMYVRCFISAVGSKCNVTPFPFNYALEILLTLLT